MRTSGSHSATNRGCHRKFVGIWAPGTQHMKIGELGMNLMIPSAHWIHHHEV